MFSGYEHFVGGICGGLASTACCHPFDLLKIRFAANEGNLSRPQYSSYWNATRTIVRANGIRGLYQGLSPSIIAAPISWGLYFHFYQKIRSQMNLSPDYPFVDNLLAGCITGAFVLSLTNPFWVCKTRLCLQYENQTEKKYKGLADCIRKIVRDEGPRGLYKGFVPGLLGTVNGSIQFALYNCMKRWRCNYLNLPPDSQLNTFDYLLFSSLSKMQSTMITFPYQLLRTRLQDQHTRYGGIVDCTLKTVKREGFLGLYKGVFAATVKQLPNGVITYVVYEHARHFLEKR